jgi:outer membrane protein assembly factor BamB
MLVARTRWLIALAVLLVAAPLAADWPQWRGANRDGVTLDFTVPKTWPATLKETWKVTVGEGHSSPVTSEGRIYVLARQGEDEVVLCLDPSKGKELWRTSYPAAYTMNPAATGHGKGPKSTPVVSGGKLFTFGINGVLSCFDSKSGKLNWRKEFSKQYPNTSPLYGTAMSPIVANGLCIVHVGGHDKGALTAFDVETGAVKWANAEDGPAYSSPVLATLAGESQLVTYTQSNVVGISATTGKLLWKMADKVPYDVNSVSPVVFRDLVIFSIHEKGVGAVRLSRQGDHLVPQEIWRNAAYESFMNTPVLAGNRLAGFSYKKKGQFFCLDADTGKMLWESTGRMGENAAILNAGNLLFFLTDEAKLFLLKGDATSFAPVKEYQVASSPTWAHPVLMGNHILVKDKTSLAALAFE